MSCGTDSRVVNPSTKRVTKVTVTLENVSQLSGLSSEKPNEGKGETNCIFASPVTPTSAIW